MRIAFGRTGITTFALAMLLASVASAQTNTALTNDYLGQTPPGSEPQLFAPGIVSTGLSERDVAITPDGNEFYFTVYTGTYDQWTILMSKKVAGKWTNPEVAPFSGNPNWREGEPHITPDGKRMFFVSDRPSLPQAPRSKNHHIWVMERTDDGWGTPRPLGAPIESEGSEYFPSVTRRGTLYYTMENRVKRDDSLYRSRLVDGKYTQPERLPDHVNTGTARFNAFIAPDESYLILCVAGRKDSIGGTDYYIAFRSPEDVWSEPINLGPKVNTAGDTEYSPYVSPDGKYFFFMSSRRTPNADLKGDRLTFDALKKMIGMPGNGNPDIYWVDAAFLTALKPK